jgi:hypothetical protein
VKERCAPNTVYKFKVWLATKHLAKASFAARSSIAGNKTFHFSPFAFHAVPFHGRGA